MTALTKRQQAVLDYVRQSIAERGYPPTRLEICERFGFSSANAAHYHLSALERKGYLHREPHTSRGLTLTEPNPVSTTGRLTAALLALAERSRETIAAFDAWDMSGPNEAATAWSRAQAGIYSERQALSEVDAALKGGE